MHQMLYINKPKLMIIIIQAIISHIPSEGTIEKGLIKGPNTV